MARILVADGARVIRQVAALLVTSLQHDVVAEASTAQEAVAAAVRFEPDVVLIDVELLGSEPGESLARFAEVRPQARVVACASLRQKEDLRRAIAAGARAGVLRPFVRSQLAEALLGVL